MFKQAARVFAQNLIRPRVTKFELDKAMPTSYVNELFEQGFMGIEVPEEYSGVGATFSDSLDVVKEISKVDPSTSLLIDIQNTLIQPLMANYATEEQKKKICLYLQQLQ